MEETKIYVDKESELYLECKKFWKYWISTHKEEYQRLCRGLPQFEDVLAR